jgi:myo-inositol-1(or 4)-monophosphatase
VLRVDRAPQRGQITQGVVYDPIRNDLFTATRGRGAS